MLGTPCSGNSVQTLSAVALTRKGHCPQINTLSSWFGRSEQEAAVRLSEIFLTGAYAKYIVIHVTRTFPLQTSRTSWHYGCLWRLKSSLHCLVLYSSTKCVLAAESSSFAPGFPCVWAQLSFWPRRASHLFCSAAQFQSSVVLNFLLKLIKK